MPQFFRDSKRRIVGVARPDHDFEVGVILPKETFEVFFQPRFHAMHRLENGDWRESIGRRVERRPSIFDRAFLELQRSD